MVQIFECSTETVWYEYPDASIVWHLEDQSFRDA